MTTILVVDDWAVDRRLAGGLLEKDGQRKVIYASDGKEALQELELHLPDLVLTDLMMPNLNGLELVEAVKKEFPLIPVILMTAQGSEEIAVQALQRGAASYVPKRRLPQDLLRIVDHVLSAAQEDRFASRVMNRMTRNEAEFVLENDPALVSSLARYLQQEIRGMRLIDDSDRLRVCLALEEALVNACFHGNLEVNSELKDADPDAFYRLAAQRAHESPWCDRRVYVTARCTRSAVAFTVRDDGPGFDISQVPDPTDPANLDRPHGRGLLLMRTFMDEVRFNPAGNEVTLVKECVREA